MVLFYSVCIRFFVAQLFLKVAREIKCPELAHCCLCYCFAIVDGYLPPDFQDGERPKGEGPLEIEFFFVEGGLRKGLEGVRRLLKPSSVYNQVYNQQKN